MRRFAVAVVAVGVVAVLAARVVEGMGRVAQEIEDELNNEWGWR
jgi:hypothetical protein